MSRARVTQLLNLLDLSPEVMGALAVFGDPLAGPVTERSLRPLLNLPADEQVRALRRILERVSAVRAESTAAS